MKSSYSVHPHYNPFLLGTERSPLWLSPEDKARIKGVPREISCQEGLLDSSLVLKKFKSQQDTTEARPPIVELKGKKHLWQPPNKSKQGQNQNPSRICWNQAYLRRNGVSERYTSQTAIRNKRLAVSGKERNLYSSVTHKKVYQAVMNRRTVEALSPLKTSQPFEDCGFKEAPVPNPDTRRSK